jgi:parallel beta-helix repeat protein
MRLSKIASLCVAVCMVSGYFSGYFAVASAAVLDPDWGDVTTNTLVCDAAQYQQNVRSMPDGQGGVILVWEDGRGTDFDIYAQRLDKDGNALWTANGVLVANEPTSDQTEPQLCSDGQGGAIITWIDERNSNEDIYAQRLDKDGNPGWNVAGEVVCNEGSAQLDPRLVPDGMGGAIFSWVDCRSANRIYVQRFDKDAAPQWTANGNDIYPIGFCNNQGMIPDGQSGAIVAFVNSGNIKGQRVNSDGTLGWGAGIDISPVTSSHSVPVISPDNNGGAVVAWINQSIHVLVQKLDKNGALLWPSGGITACGDPGDIWGVNMVPDGQGGGIMVWGDYRSGVTRDIYAQRVNSTGAVLWAADGEVIRDAAGNTMFVPVDMVPSGTGGAIMVWQDYRGADADIYAQYVTKDGKILWEEDGLAVSTATGQQESPTVSLDSGWLSGNQELTTGWGKHANENKGIIIAWQDDRLSPNDDIYAQAIIEDYSEFNYAATLEWGGPSSSVHVCNTGGDPQYVQVISDGFGGTILTWKDERGVDDDIYAQRMDKHGNPVWGINEKVVCTATGNQQLPVICTDGQGGAIIAWEDNRVPANGTDVWAQRLDSDGNPVWNIDGIQVCGKPNNQADLRIIPDGTGGAFILWGDRALNANPDLFIERIDKDGNPQLNFPTGWFMVVGANWHYLHSMIPDGQGGAIVSWHSGSGSDWNVYVQRMAHDGNKPWGATVTSVATINNNQKNPKLISDGLGGAIITWIDDNDWTVWAQRIESNGNLLWGPAGKQMNTISTGMKQMLQMVPDGQGGAIVTWEDWRTSSLWEVYGEKINSTGDNQWTGGAGINLFSATNWQSFDKDLIPDGRGGALLIVMEDLDDDSDHDLFAQIICSNGSLPLGAGGMLVNDEAGNTYSPILVTDGQGGGIATWFNDWAGYPINQHKVSISNIAGTVHNVDSGEDFMTIQEAINDPDTMNGHTIMVDAGTFKENVVVDKRLTLIGAGNANTIIDGNGTGDVIMVASSWVNITGFNITNGGSSAGDSGVEINGVSYCRIKDNSISYNGWFGINMINGHNHTVFNNTMTVNNQYALYMSMITDNEVLKNTVSLASTYAFSLYSVSHTNITSNDISDSPEGIRLRGSCENNTLRFNNVTGTGIGISMGDSSYNTVLQNNLSSNTDKGILLEDNPSSGKTRFNDVMYNNLTGNSPWGIDVETTPYINNLTGNNITGGSSGIQLLTSSNISIEGNNVTNANNGIQLIGSDHNTLIDNDVYSSNNIGIWFNTGSENNTCEDNGVNESYAHGIYLSAGWNNVTNNWVCNGTPGVAYGITYGDATNTNISGNNIFHNNAGILIQSESHNNTFWDNEIRWNRIYGIWQQAGGGSRADNRFISNNITDNGLTQTCDGMLLEGVDADDNDIIDNWVENNGRHGIYIESSDRFTITDNTVINNQANGIYVGSSSGNTVEDNDVIGNGNNGIQMISTDDNQVFDNYITGNGAGAASNEAGIRMAGNSDRNDVYDNNISNNIDNGIILTDGWYNDIFHNEISHNGRTGINWETSGNQWNDFYDNNITYNQRGIYCSGGCQNNNITYNNITHSTVSYGIYMDSTTNINITGNNISNNAGWGIDFDGGYGNIVFNNTISWNPSGGINTDGTSNDHQIIGNEIHNGSYGVWISWGTGLDVIGNTIASNTNHGLWIQNSDNTTIYHNFFIGNAVQAYDDTNDNNSWDDGYPSGGNYWDDFDEGSEGAWDNNSGPAQNVTGPDGIADDPYPNIGGGSGALDNYPLMTLADIDDIHPPVSAADAIAPYWQNVNPLTITAQAYDSRGMVTSVELWYSSGGPILLFGTDNNGLDGWSWDFDWPDLEGIYMFYTRAYDDSGNYEAPPGVSDTEAGYDGTDPVSSVDAIAPYWQNTDPFQITATANDPLSNVTSVELWYSFEGAGYLLFGTDSNGLDGWSWDFDWPSGEGNYSFYSRAHDTAGNYEAAPGGSDATAGYDVTPPVSSVDTIAPYWHSTITLTIIAAANDAMSGVSDVELWYSHEGAGYLPFGTDANGLDGWSWSFTWPSGEGNYSFYSRAHDTTGNYESSPGTPDTAAGYDLIPPNSSVNVLVQYWHNVNPLTINGTANDTMSGVADTELWFSYEGAGYLLFGTDSNGIDGWSWDFTWPNGEGNYSFYSMAHDTVGNYELAPGVSDVSAGYDVTVPQVNAGGNVTTNILFTQNATVSDVRSGVATYLWTQLSGPGIVTFGNASAEDTSITADTDGIYVIQLNVTDNAGNWAVENVTLVWDPTPPEIILYAPLNNSVVSPGTTLDFNVTDHNLDVVMYSVNGGAFATLSAPYDIDTVNWTDGTYMIEISANDTLGNSIIRKFTFMVDGTPPTVISTIPADGTQNVILNTTIVITFSEPMDAVSVVGALSFSAGFPGTTPSWNANDTILTLTLATALAQDTTFTITLGTGAQDALGNNLASAYAFSFTSWLDTDGDGVPDPQDTDDDNDGVPDLEDDLPTDPTETTDTDGDGMGDNADTDDDGDGTADADDAFPLDPAEMLDTDGDGIGNNADTDDDGDGIPDSEDENPLTPNEPEAEGGLPSYLWIIIIIIIVAAAGASGYMIMGRRAGQSPEPVEEEEDMDTESADDAEAAEAADGAVVEKEAIRESREAQAPEQAGEPAEEPAAEPEPESTPESQPEPQPEPEPEPEPEPSPEPEPEPQPVQEPEPKIDPDDDIDIEDLEL